VEAEFRRQPGVIATAVGYTGGKTSSPTYESVCSGRTGHCEAVLVEYDPKKISYGKLLDVFWRCHNPTQGDRQGLDIGSQYRSAIFTYSKEQQESAERSRDRLRDSGKYKDPITTQIVAASQFWLAEEYHQQYYEKNGLASCRIR
jgi:peptide-methionine (S)-S-oxide reductase